MGNELLGLVTLGYLVRVLVGFLFSFFLYLSGFFPFLVLYVPRAQLHWSLRIFSLWPPPPRVCTCQGAPCSPPALTSSQRSFLCLGYSSQRRSIVSTSWRVLMHLVGNQIGCGSKLTESEILLCSRGESP